MADPTFSPVRGFVTFETFIDFFEPISKPLDLPALVDGVEDPSFGNGSALGRIRNVETALAT